MDPPVPATRHAHLYQHVTLPTTANFNESDVSNKPAWVRVLPPFVAANVTYMNYYQQRLRSLRAVDELVGRVVAELKEQGLLNNTYIIYTGDNGYHIGAHRQGAGKETPYEDDIRVPFYIRGPGLQQGAVSHAIGSHVDLAATILSLVGGKVPEVIDGQPLPLQESALPGAAFVQPEEIYESTPLEYWGAHLDQITGHVDYNFSYKAVRADFGAGRLFKYSVWCNGDLELYDLNHDPDELLNLAAPGVLSQYYSGDDITRVINRLDALLSAWYTCQGSSQCVQPLKRVLPGVGTLGEALDPQHDAFFAGLPRYQYNTCLGYFSWDNEVGAFDAALRPQQPPTPPVDWSQVPLPNPGNLGGPSAGVGTLPTLTDMMSKQTARKVLGRVSSRQPLRLAMSSSSGVGSGGFVTHAAGVEAFSVPLSQEVLQMHARQLRESVNSKRWELSRFR